MKLYRTKSGALIEHSGFRLLPETDWSELVNGPDPGAAAASGGREIGDDEAQRLIADEILLPADRQEIWAAGVTYYRSRTARMDESKDAGGGDFYDRVYSAPRPEIFFKCNPFRAVAPGAPVRIRRDSKWNVPEPEWTLFINSAGKIAGYTIGNDMSSRSIEGENPLYLPQAKSYDGCASLGPCIYMPKEPFPRNTEIRLRIERGGAVGFEDAVTLEQMKRTADELLGYLTRECTFPRGGFLMTGTGIVPPNDFTLQSGDLISITIDPIGTLSNPVA